MNDRTDNIFQKNKFDQLWYQLVSDGYFEAKKLNFIQYPSADGIGYAVEQLHGLGFIDHEYKPTIFGMYGSKFRKIKLESIRMILAGYHNEANILDLVTIVCCLQIGFELGIKKKKYTPRNPLDVSKEIAFYNYKLLFADEFIEYIFIWNDFMNVIGDAGDILKRNAKKPKIDSILKHNTLDNINKWCNDNAFKLDGFLKVIELRDEVIGDMMNMGINPYYNGLGLSRGKYNLTKILRNNIVEGIDEIKKIKR
jgi:hypothetical protein